MDFVVKGKGKKKKGLFIKTWERCKSLGRAGAGAGCDGRKSNNRGRQLKHSKSWPTTAGLEENHHQQQQEEEEDGRDRNRGRRRIAPEGCFSVYVGPKKQRFVIRTECLKHPLFKELLEEAESEYGYNSEGPLELPCEVDIFIKVLIEIYDSDDGIISSSSSSAICSSFRGRSYYSSYHLLTTSTSTSSPKKIYYFP